MMMMSGKSAPVAWASLIFLGPVQYSTASTQGRRSARCQRR